MSDEFQGLLERAALDPDPAFVADVEAQLVDDGSGRVLAPWGRPVPPRRRTMAAAAALGAVAVVVAGLAVASRGHDARPGGSSTPSSARAIPAATTVPTSMTSPAATTTATTMPATSVTAVTTATAAVAVPSSLAVTTTTEPSSGALPAGFTPVSITHVSVSHLWVLGADDAGSPHLFESLDTGRTFQPASLPPGFDGDVVSTKVRFASALDGYVSGAGLWSTHDGARTWREIRLPGSDVPDARFVFDVAALDGEVTVATMAGLFAGPIDRDDFRPVGRALNVGGGPVPGGHFVLVHGGGWFVMNNRAFVDARRQTADGWIAWTPPCAAGRGLVQLAASDATHLVAVCDDRMADDAPGRIYRSDDGGTTFSLVGTLPGLPAPGGVAMASADAAVVAVQRGVGPVELVGVFRGRADLPVVWTGDGTTVLIDLGFTSATHGSAVAAGIPGAVLQTVDGGRSWRPVGGG